MTAEPPVIDIPPFLVTGITVRTSYSDEKNRETARLPGLWERFYSEALAAEIPHALPDTPMYGVYYGYDSDYRGEFNTTAGVAVTAASDSNRFQTVQVPGGKYMVFEAKGTMPEIVVQTWGSIWEFFETNGAFKRRYTTDFELYKAADEIAIHIAV
jgi:predicted transcriptional regulator YdeE